MMDAIDTVLIAMIAGAIRVSTPFLFVSLGECLTEVGGRINLGNEGALVLGAMTGYAASFQTGSPWLGVAAAALAGSMLGGVHGALCALKRVNDVAVGIAVMLAGTGIAFFFGKPYVQPSAPHLPTLPFGLWSSSPQVRSALEVSPLFFAGIAVAVVMWWALRTTRAGLAAADRGGQCGCGAGAGAEGQPGPLRRDGNREWTGGDRGRVPVVELSRELERGVVVRAGVDGGGARRVRALEPAVVHRRSPGVWRGRGARPVAAGRSASLPGIICSTPRPTSLRC